MIRIESKDLKLHGWKYKHYLNRMYNQQDYGGYGAYGQQGTHPNNYNAYGDNYSKGGYYGNPAGYSNDRYGTYGQQGYNYGAKPNNSGCDECLACLGALCCCCVMCDMLT